MAQQITAAGRVTELDPENGQIFTLAEVRRAIGGGYIEIVGLRDGRLMIVDEDGKLKRLPLNWLATQLYDRPPDVIVGDVLVVARDQIE